MKSRQDINHKEGEGFTMKILAQEAKKRESVVKWAERKGKSQAAGQYGVSLSSVKRWSKRYDGTWESLAERSHRPHRHPKQHTAEEESAIRAAFSRRYSRYGWDGVYDELVKKHGYKRSFGGMYRAAVRIGLGWGKKRKPPRKFLRRYPELGTPGEKVQVDVKEVPYNCLKGEAKRDGKHLYQWTAIDECTRVRYVFGYWEHTPENSVDFLKRLQAAFPFKMQTIQTDNGTEFTYKFISEDEPCPFDVALEKAEIVHKLIPPRTPWRNGKVERSHRNDQRYFYDWEKFGDVGELNRKLAEHLEWSNNKTMRTLGRKSPAERLAEFQEAA
jgi:transposase InsO family protein